MKEFLVNSGSGSNTPEYMQIEYVTPGTYQLEVKEWMLPMHIVAVAGGGGYARVNGGDNTASAPGGGGLAYANNLDIKIGTMLTIVVGDGGRSWGYLGWSTGNNGEKGGNSSVTGTKQGASTATALVSVNGGSPGTYGGGGMVFGGAGGTVIAGTGFPGGDGGYCGTSWTVLAGGGGAGGYSGAGGKGHNAGYQILPPNGWTAGTGGSGAGARDSRGVTRGGGVGLRGEGPSGNASDPNGSNINGTPLCGGGASGGTPRGLAGGVRIMFGAGRAYPSTNTADIAVPA